MVSAGRLSPRWGVPFFALLFVLAPHTLVAQVLAETKDINPASSSDPMDLVDVNGVLFFSANDGTNGRELWKSNGTLGGTSMVKNINPAGASSDPTGLVNVSGVLFFSASDGVKGKELWKSDGTQAGTTMVKDINLGGGDSTPIVLTNWNGLCYFTAGNGSNGPELWKSDGTPGGTMMVLDIRSGSSGSSPNFLTPVKDKLFFSANDGTNGIELWVSDGSPGGTKMVKDINSAGDSAPDFLTNVNGTLFFEANDGLNGLELWKSDGTLNGTMMVMDIRPGPGGSFPNFLTNVNGVLFFAANDGVHGLEPWRSDGSPGGTQLIKDVGPASGFDGFVPFAVNGQFFFLGDGELWKSDGTPEGTVLVKDINSGSGGSFPDSFTSVNGLLCFRATDGANGFEPWVSNGTEAGTIMLTDIPPAGAGSSPNFLTASNGILFFGAFTPANGNELWWAAPPDSDGDGIPDLADSCPNIQSLTLGAGPTVDTLTSTQGSCLFTLSLPVGKPVVITLTDSDPEDANALYIRWGAAPKPYLFDQAAATRYQSNQRLVISQARDEVCYILVQATLVHGGANDVLILAQVEDLSLQEMSLLSGSPGSSLSARIRGGGFDETTLFSLEKPGTRIDTLLPPVIVTSGIAEAVFDVKPGTPPGLYALKARRGSFTAELPNAFEVVPSGSGPILEVQLTGPRYYRYNRPARLLLRYRNSGDQEMTAPLRSHPGRIELRSIQGVRVMRA